MIITFYELFKLKHTLSLTDLLFFAQFSCKLLAYKFLAEVWATTFTIMQVEIFVTCPTRNIKRKGIVIPCRLLH